eukprot:1737838-Rhodomonas_salina.1
MGEGKAGVPQRAPATPATHSLLTRHSLSASLCVQCGEAGHAGAAGGGVRAVPGARLRPLPPLRPQPHARRRIHAPLPPPLAPLPPPVAPLPPPVAPLPPPVASAPQRPPNKQPVVQPAPQVKACRLAPHPVRLCVSESARADEVRVGRGRGRRREGAVVGGWRLPCAHPVHTQHTLCTHSTLPAPASASRLQSCALASGACDQARAEGAAEREAWQGRGRG